MNPIRVLVVDDHPVFRYGLQALLVADPDTAFAGEAATGDEAIARVLTDPPDVVLMDINMPGVNGIDATRRLLERLPNLAVLVVTMAEDDDAVIAAGAKGYIVKGSPSEQILRAIRAAADGEAIFSPRIATRLASFLASPSPLVDASRAASLATLTQREREILDLIAAGLTNAAVADRLFLSVKTIGNRVGEIFEKIGVANRNEAIVAARDAGLGTGDANTSA